MKFGVKRWQKSSDFIYGRSLEVLTGIFHFSTNRTSIKPTELRMNENYQHYYLGWSRSILLAFIPFLLLSILNGKIIFQLQKSKNDPITRVSIFSLQCIVLWYLLILPMLTIICMYIYKIRNRVRPGGARLGPIH